MNANAKTLLIANIHKKITEEELRELFAQYGILTCTKIKFDRGTALGMGIGFVTFKDVSSAVAA